MQYQIFQNGYFFNKANFSKKVPFKNSYFFRKATFWKLLIVQRSNIPQLTVSEEVLFKSCISFPQLHFLVISFTLVSNVQ